MKRVLCILFMAPLLGFSQQLPLSAQYTINPYFLSPAFSGHNANYEAFLGYQRSWLGIQGAPELKLFNVNGPIGEKMGIGASVIDDQVGIFRSLQMTISYAYHLQVGASSKVSFGAQVGMIDQHIEMPNGGFNDPAALLVQGNQKKHLNAGVGVNYQWKNLDAGIVVPYLLQNTTQASDSGSAAYIQSRHYRLHARYLYGLNADWSIRPMAVANFTGKSFHADFNALVNYKNFAWLGVGYNTGNAVNIHVGGLPLTFLSVQYSYGISGNGILAESNGNHEFTLGLLIGASDSQPSSIFGRKPSDKQKSYYKWLNF